ncbi:uncharacterized protein EI90DRAFT_3017426 [Cantharellus anzutake]|uniref:uncharacterized protein n=1 Tax=Cantharellus anzutake TaxID=1750568 RepID=UPI0019069F5D|nr:uncharacterized protein EI90DRAFT_3017426 [Cantharellus anzutake]KAF8328799.1 hypothetical protein EI90DRAFT_3017426 [Cantharellus anzutake]
MSSPASAIKRPKETNGCLICRLRKKKCNRISEGDRSCEDCSRLLLHCIPQHGVLHLDTAELANMAEWCKIEIKSAIDARRTRCEMVPLPRTLELANTLRNAEITTDPAVQNA